MPGQVFFFFFLGGLRGHGYSHRSWRFDIHATCSSGPVADKEIIINECSNISLGARKYMRYMYLCMHVYVRIQSLRLHRGMLFQLPVSAYTCPAKTE